MDVGEPLEKLFHGTFSDVAKLISVEGFKPGRFGTVFFAEDLEIAKQFSTQALPLLGQRSSINRTAFSVIQLTVPVSIADQLEISYRYRRPIGEFTGSIYWEGYERILKQEYIQQLNDAIARRTIDL
ncbi:hypothetical protein [Gloeobacter violaceus]|uniref:hypothetical protein n=1 Tax=Gloeobacter violaceus TaxID=33072 RepID=UPI0013E8B73D|nr:hypothetical protein [Gloeobacter violaceus]